MNASWTDAAAELAAEYGIDLEDVHGSGADGKVMKADVEAHIEAALNVHADVGTARAPARREAAAAGPHRPKLWTG